LHSIHLVATAPLLLHGYRQVFGVGFAGGFIAELLALYEVRHGGELPTYLRSWFFWIISLVMAVLGGGLTLLYGYDEVQGLLALNIGLSAPLHPACTCHHRTGPEAAN
jgi:hypothetical protein